MQTKMHPNQHNPNNKIFTRDISKKIGMQAYYYDIFMNQFTLFLMHLSVL